MHIAKHTSLLRAIFVGVFTLVMMLVSFSPSVLAVDECGAALGDRLNIASPLTIFGDFATDRGVIPKKCSVGSDGKPIPIKPSLIPAIALRVFNLIVGLIFYASFAVTVFSGLQYAYGGLDGKQGAQAISNLTYSAYSIVLVVSTFIIINTIMFQLFGADGTALLGRDLGGFFTFN